jgi:hypothetical protein
MQGVRARSGCLLSFEFCELRGCPKKAGRHRSRKSHDNKILQDEPNECDMHFIFVLWLQFRDHFHFVAWIQLESLALNSVKILR